MLLRKTVVVGRPIQVYEGHTLSPSHAFSVLILRLLLQKVFICLRIFTFYIYCYFRF